MAKAPNYTHLHGTGFDLRPGAISDLAADGAVLTFDPSWVQPLRELFQQRKPNLKTLPIWSLNTAAVALVPGIAANWRGVGTRGGEWLYAVKPHADGTAVYPDTVGPEMLIPAWARVEAGPASAEQALRLWQQLAAGGLHWSDADGDRFTWAAAKADTPEATAAIAAVDPGLWHLLPEILADRLLRTADRPGGFPRGFRRAPSSQTGVELVSWPPMRKDPKKKDPGYYSYRVTFSLQSLPHCPNPQLIVHVGLRRWLSREAFRKGRAAVNAHLLSSLPWLQGQSTSTGFRVIPMVRRKIQDDWRLDFEQGTRDIFDYVTFSHPLPDLEQLTKAPAEFLTLTDPAATAVGLPYASTYDGKHPIGSGVTARDRDMIIHWVAESLADFLVSPVPAPKVALQVASKKAPEGAVARERIAAALGWRHLTVEIHHDSVEDPELRQALRDAVIADLGLDNTDQATWRTPELDVTIEETPVGARASALDPVKTAKAGKAQALRRAVEARRGLIAEQLPAADGTALAFVELGGRATYKDSATDPKGAIRVGYIAAGRLTQFITPVQPGAGNVTHRAKRAWMDLRRQLVGCLTPPQVILRGKDGRALALPEVLDTVGIYMLRRNATDRNWTGREQTPVAVWISSDTAETWARIPGIEAWVPYRDLHGLLAHGIAFKETSTDQNAAQAFIRTVLSTTRSADRPVLLQTWTQNLRSVWPELSVSKLLIDTPLLGGKPLGGLFDGFRLVTVRTKDANEIPETYGVTDDPDVLEDTGGRRFGMPSGLWHHPASARTFISTAGRPDSAKTHASNMESRIAPRLKEETDPETGEKRIVEIWKLDKNAFNAHPLHLTTAWLQSGDDPLAWAALTHAHRDLGEAYDETLKLPIALHLAKKATEYAFPDSADNDTVD